MPKASGSSVEFEELEKYFADEGGEMPNVLPNPDTHLCTLGEDSDTASRGEQTSGDNDAVETGDPAHLA